MNSTEKIKSKVGLASASPETRKRVATMGGIKAHESGNAHQWTVEDARKAGRLGGLKVSQNREHMREIGRKGGANSHGGNHL